MYSCSSYVAGFQPFNDWFDPDTVQRHPLGLVCDGVDPWWGPGTFMYVAAQSTMERGTLAQYSFGTITRADTTTFLGLIASDLPNTANLGRQFGVLMQSMVTAEYGWMMLAGFAVLSAQASVAADTAIAVAAAGQVGALANGKQLNGTRNVYASTNTLAKTNTLTKNGSSTLLTTSGYDGWFVGMALSGTGIPASTVVAKLDPDGRTVYMGSAIGTVDKLATATAGVTVTGTWTGYLGTMINHPFAQGQTV